MPTLICPECKRTFERNANRQKYCSLACRTRRNNRLHLERHREDNRERSAQYYRVHRDEQRSKGREWFAANREKANAKRRQWHTDHRDEANERSRKRHLENREKANATRRQWHADHREEANQKRSERYRADVLADPTLPKRMSAAQSARERVNQPWLKLLRSALGRSRMKKVPFDLTSDWAEARWTGRCELTDIPFNMGLNGKPGGRSYSPSIDRIRPELGYTPENCRFILYGINRFKGEMSDAEMLIMARLIVTALDGS